MQRRLVLTILLLAAPAAWSQAAGEPAAVLAACIEASAEAETETLEELEVECPGIEHALVEMGYAPFISESQLDELGWYNLQELQALRQRYAQAAAGADVRTDSLAPILNALQDKEAERPPTWFDRLKRRLRDLFDRQGESSSWLNNWLADKELPGSVREFIVYAVVFISVVLAILVILNELRAAGVLRRRAGAAKQSPAAPGKPVTSELTLADLESAAPGDRPSVMLRLLVAALVQRGRLRADRSLTHRELTARVALEDAGQRESFARVASLSEKAVYSGGTVPIEEIDAAVAAGRTLIAALAATPMTAASTSRGAR